MFRKHGDPHVSHSEQASSRRRTRPDLESTFALQEARGLIESKKTHDAAIKFGRLLRRLREKAKMTQWALATGSSSDWKHVRRLENGEVKRTGRYTVLRLSQALLDNSNDITLEDVDRLLNAAGYGPLPRNRISIVELRR